MISTKIVITDFHEKIRKLSFLFFRLLKMFLKSREKGLFSKIKFVPFKISKPDSLRVNQPYLDFKILFGNSPKPNGSR